MKILKQIVDGRVTLAFRRWKRPTVKAGGTLMTARGQLEILAVDQVDAREITLTDANAAGFDDLAGLHEMLDKRPGGSIYRIGLRYLGADPRIALRELVPTSTEELSSIVTRLDRYDTVSKAGPWTRDTLTLISQRPATLAAELAHEIGQDRDRFKTNVRKLKGLGLTESLKVGYRLSPRGQAVLGHLTVSINALGADC